MEQNLDQNLSPDSQLPPAAKKFPLWLITLLVVIAILIAGTGYWFIYSKISPLTVQDSQSDLAVLAVSSSSNTKISWVSNPTRLASIFSSKKNNRTMTSVSAECLPGTQCQDSVGVFETVIPNYYACKLDTQCSFFTGFTGTQTGNELPQTNVPAQTRNSTSGSTQPPGGGLPTANPTLPTAVQGSEGCFNKQELLKSALNKEGLTEVTSTKCECGIQPPSSSGSGTPGAVDGSSSVVTSGTISSFENQVSEALSCMRPQMRPDIMTENFIFPQSVNINSQFSISFDYKNVGAVGCSETYFQVDVTRTIAGQSEYLGGSGAHIEYATPLNSGEGNIFTFGSQILSPFSIVGDYKLDLTMFCESPRETHVVNNTKEINIKVLATSNPQPKIIKAPVSSTITVLSPNGGETWTKGTTQTIKWQDNTKYPPCPVGANCINPAPKNYDIKLTPYYPPCTTTICPLHAIRSPYTLAKGVSGTSFTWSVAKILDLGGSALDGAYTIQICQTGTTICDSSNSYFKIVSSTVKSSITVLSPNGGEKWQIGSQQKVMWGGINNIPANYRLWIRLDSNSIFRGSLKVINPSSYPNGVYNLTVPDSVFESDVGTQLPPGPYILRMTLFDGEPCLSIPTCNPKYNWGKVVSEDTSDAPFTITPQK